MRTTAAAIVVLVACGSCGSSKPPEGPKLDDRVKALEAELQKAKDDLAKAGAAADDLRRSEAELKAKADEAAALQAKLAAVVGNNGEVTTADGAVKLELIDQILFPTGEADLTAGGKDLLSKVGAALKEIGDKQVWVQGHTDDQPIYLRKPSPVEPNLAKDKLAKLRKEKPGKPDPKAKPDPKVTKPDPKVTKPDPKAKPDTNDAVLAFVTNWELSAARALTVVHYLQDEARLDPTRLAAVAFGQYRPVSRLRAKNRRIEIVLYPRARLTPK